MFDRDLKKFSSKVAFIEGDKALSYEELESQIELIVKQLPKKKQLIAMEMKQSIDAITTYLAALRAGHTLLMVDPTIDNSKKEHLYTLYKPNYIYRDNKLKKHESTTHKLYKNLTLLLPTSGSTGSTKYVRLSKENIYANANSIVEYLPLSSDDITITSLPLYYSYGLSVLHTYLQVGATLICSDEPITSKQFWKLFETHKCTNFNGVPFHYEILSRLKITRKELPSLRFFTQAGGKLNQKYVEEFAKYTDETNREFYVMYGQTEATARISYLQPKKLLKKPTSIGKAIPHGNLSLEKDELVYRGENVMLGYATTLKDLALGDEQNGVLYTGDLARVDEDGDFYIIGRAKRFVKIYGNRINLDEMEQKCKTAFEDVVVIGDDSRIIIFYKENKEQIETFVDESYRAYKRIIHLQKVDTFLVISSGKINYQKMWELVV